MKSPLHKGLFAVIFIYMKRSVQKTRWNLIVILVIFTALTYSVVKYFTPVPQQADIFAITTDTLMYGNTTLSGTIRKDSPLGKNGRYMLILEDSRPVALDVVGLDNLIGFKVKAIGYLLEATTDRPLFMKVDSITLTQ